MWKRKRKLEAEGPEVAMEAEVEAVNVKCIEAEAEAGAVKKCWKRKQYKSTASTASTTLVFETTFSLF